MKRHRPSRIWPLAMVCAAVAITASLSPPTAHGQQTQGQSLADVIDGLLPTVAKIYGAGGLRGLEAYQSGIVISAEGHILTVFSYVLDSDMVTVTLNDGRRFQVELVGAHPRLELAVLKIDATDLPHVELTEAASAGIGTRVLALSNLFGVATGNEPASVQHGVVAAVAPLTARRGVFQTPYSGNVYVLDVVTNNPGAAGGLLADQQGRFLGMLGKELRNTQTNSWLNYAIPVAEMASSVEEILSGRFAPVDLEAEVERAEDPLSPERLGLVLVPDVLERTPAFIDDIRPGSPAEGVLQADDLVLFVNDRLVQSCQSLRAELERFDAREVVRLTVERNHELVNVDLELSGEEHHR